MNILNCRGLEAYVVEDNKRLRPAAILVADGVENTLPHDRWQKLLNKESQEDPADRGQIKVVDQEERLQLERLPVAHQLPAPENEDIVAYDENARLFQGWHRSLASLESKVVGRIAHNSLEGLVEVGP